MTDFLLALILVTLVCAAAEYRYYARKRQAMLENIDWNLHEMHYMRRQQR